MDDKNNTFIFLNLCPKISGRGKKKLPMKRVWENVDRIYSEIASKTLTNERTINRIFDKSFKEIESISKLINVFECFNKENKARHAKFHFRHIF